MKSAVSFTRHEIFMGVLDIMPFFQWLRSPSCQLRWPMEQWQLFRYVWCGQSDANLPSHHGSRWDGHAMRGGGWRDANAVVHSGSVVHTYELCRFFLLVLLCI